MMRITSDFLDAQVALCGRMADAAVLSNQRAMFLRAQAAWQVLAAKEQATRTERAKRAAGPAPV